MKKIKDWEKEFFDRLSEELERLFPKTNQDNPEIPSKGNRTTALTFNALANIIFKDILEKALTQQRQEIVKEVIKFVESESGKSGRKEIVEYLKQELTK